MKTIETTGHIRKNGLIELTPVNDYISEVEWLKAANNEAFRFLNEPDEDIYTTKDGKPVSE